MLSGKDIAKLLSFDVFYAINGEDKNTAMRGTGEWNNLFGVYAGLDMEKVGVKGLGISVGYTASFVKYEIGEKVDGAKMVAFETISPLWSGVDIKIKFSGINKMGITFNNNISFASAQGAEIKKASDPEILGILGLPLDKDENEDWFAYDVILGVNYALTDHLNVTFALGNLLTVFSADSKSEVMGVTTTNTGKATTDELRISLHAEYSVGNVTFGLGLNLGLENKSFESETKTTGSGPSGTATVNGSLNIVKFSVPLFFKVAI